jgi:hypothetical protein
MTPCILPKRARVVFTTSRSWYSAIIRWAQGSSASHVMLQFDVFGQDLFMHASVGGIQFSPRERFLKSNRVVSEFEIQGEVPRERIAQMIDHLNDSYDYVGLVGFAVTIGWRKITGRNTHNLLASHTAMVCSEFVARLDPNGELIGSFAGLEPEITTPETLRLACVAATVTGQLKEITR